MGCVVEGPIEGRDLPEPGELIERARGHFALEPRIDIAPFEIDKLVRECVNVVQPQASALGLSIETTLEPYIAEGDRGKIKQVLLNLLTNAIKYNRRGGSVHVEAQRLDAEVALRVRDSGRGMVGDQLAHVFEPFNRLGLESKGIEGTGIGLAIVKANVERMGGSVGVQSEIGHGSRFWIRLAAAGAQKPPRPARQSHSFWRRFAKLPTHV